MTPSSAPSSPNLAFDPTPVSLALLLAEHSNDPQRALSALVARHNRLLQDHAVLKSEKEAAEKASERSAQENQQLWRSLKAIGNASPRPGTQRQNSEGTQGGREKENSRALGTGTAPSIGGEKPPKRGASGDLTGKLDLPPPLPLHSSPRSDSDQLIRFPNAHAFSAAALRHKAATPPPSASPRATDATGAALLRKASSLDLGRPQTAPGEGDIEMLSTAGGPYPTTPPIGKGGDSRNGSPRIPSSSSMPSIADRGPDRRFLPTITPVSPLFQQSDSTRSSPRERETSSSTSVSASALQQLQPPPSHPLSHDPTHRVRDRTLSNISGTSSLASAFDERGFLPTPSRSASASLLPTTPSSHSLATLGDSPHPRERQPSAIESSSRKHMHGQHDSDASTASSSRRPSQATSSIPAPQALRIASALPSTVSGPPSPRTSLVPSYLPFTRIRVGSSNIKMNDRGKEIISFLIDVIVSVPPESDPDHTGNTSWRVEKMYSDVLGLDAMVKQKSNRQESKSIGALPDKSLFKDHAPHKSDQRKAVLERYLQTLVSIPLRDRSAICTFFNTDIAHDPPTAPSAGAMEGWLTKRGRSFGGWQTRYYVLTPGSVLSYYDSPGGKKNGEIPLQNAAIGRQSSRTTDASDDAYLHAFLIRTQNDKEQEADHILCAENDEARDAWVQALTTLQPRGGTSRANGVSSTSIDRERTQTNNSTASNAPLPPPTLVSPPDSDPPHVRDRDRRRSGSGPVPSTIPEQDPRSLSTRSASDLPPSVSLPANLDAVARGSNSLDAGKKSATSDHGHGSIGNSSKLQPPSSRRPSGHPDRPLSPDRRLDATPISSGKYSASDVSGPMNAVPLPSGYEFKKAERQKKTKSSFWNFAARGIGSSDKASTSPSQAPAAPARPVFGVPLKEAVAISRIRPGLELPAVVYRCVEYLEAKNAEHEEGIFRLSGSANVIRVLKDRFNAEGDVNLLQSNEYYDPHAVAGLLKQYLRELPVHLLTRELHGEFLRVIDLRNRRDRVNALGKLVARLPIEEYTLFRFFFAHLCVIAQNAETSKMNLRNLGIVFSPTLAIPAPLFSLLLAEFDLVFAVEKETGTAKPIMVDDEPSEEATSPTVETRRANRNSLLYQASGADKLMESELIKLKETDEPEDETTSDPLEETFDNFEDGAEDTAPVEQSTTDPSYLAYPIIPYAASFVAPIPPRSPGLPSSPRPGAVFSNSDQFPATIPLTPTR
ncbi:hypothetical protein JCM1841_003099 [Sporobolomyces salmonicolor]